MLLKIYQYIRGYVRIRITGHRMERFINACNYRKIKIWDLSASDGSYEMNLWVKDFKKLRHISHKTSTKITIVKKYGLPFYLFDHRRRKLFFAGIFAATVLLLIMSGYIWDIEILGTHTQTEEVIRTFLKENHVNTGIRRGNIDCDRIVKDIRKGFDDIIWVSASIEGTRLIIQIKENEDAKIDNKTDIKKREDIEEIYSKAKYKIFSVSAERQDGTDLLMGYLKDKTTAFAGLSGVGKSSLLSIITNGELETGSISEKISRGKHTTRHVELFELESGGFVLDTPGFSSLEIENIKADDLWQYFPEMAASQNKCRFRG